MIGDNLPPLPTTADDARAYAAAIAALRDQIEAVEAEYKPHLDALAEEAKAYRVERDGKTAPLVEAMEARRKALAAYLENDPDMQLKDDGGAVLATLAKAKPTIKIEASKLPKAFMVWKPDEKKIALALALGETIKGVTVTKNYSLRVME